jgi:hypothetical protein
MWNQIWHEHQGSIVGLVSGLLLGFIYLFTGFWNMLVFTFIVFFAFIAGKHYSKLDSFLQILVERVWNRFR